MVNVTTEYPGASAEIIESQVSQILEASIAGIAGIETISSNSRSEISQITVRFRLGTDADVAASDVRDRVGRVRKQLARRNPRTDHRQGRSRRAGRSSTSL